MIWKEIPDFEGLYSVSNTGEVYSHIRNKTLSPHIDRYGYPVVGLSKKGKSYTRTIHRLVALTFIPNPCNKPTVNHINEIKTDNRVENLEWMTVKENDNHGTRNHNMALTKCRKPVIHEADGKLIHYMGVKDASRKTGIAHSQISRYCKDISNKEWRYVNG